VKLEPENLNQKRYSVSG